MSINLTLAPIRGITTAIFRRVFNNYFPGFDSAIAPFIPTTIGDKISHSHMRDIAPKNNIKSLMLIPQLIGNNPENFIVMAKYLADSGYTTVNWNLGCPAPTIITKKRGCGLMPYPERICSFLDSIYPQLPLSLSIKIRLGMESYTELEILIEQLNKYPIKELIIHPRLGKQNYDGNVDIVTFGRILNNAMMPIGYSGDITSLNFFCELKKMFPSVNTWMIGRGILKMPLLISLLTDAKLPSSNEYNTILRRYHDDLYAEYTDILSGPASVLGRMKELWCYLITTYNNDKKRLKEILKAKTFHKYNDAVKKLFTTCKARFPT